MKPRLPILTLAGLLLGLTAIFAQTPPFDVEPIPDVTVELPNLRDREASKSGNRLMADAMAAVSTQTSIIAKIRQRTDLFGHELVGTGTYQQLGVGSDQRLRLELKVQVADRVTSLQQISDARFLWIRNDLGGDVQLSRIDLDKVRRALAKHEGKTAPNPGAQWPALGGLPKLLRGLNENFDFGKPRRTQLSDIPVWTVEGTWRREKLAGLLPDQKDDILAGRPARLDELPEHLPDSVSVVLGQDDLFPYRIQYHRHAAAGGAVDPSSPSKVIVSLELYEVLLGEPIDPLRFVYKPGDQLVADRTDRFLQSIGVTIDN